jgi:hypothetical protein
MALTKLFDLATPAVIADAVERFESIQPALDLTVEWGMSAEANTAAILAAASSASFDADAAESARAAAVIAKTAAELAKTAAQAVPTTTAGLMDAVFADATSAPSKRLTATYATQWKPSTAYTAGQQVIAPNGNTVSAVADFTSGTVYSDANWRMGTVPNSVPLAKPTGDARASVWEYTHAAAFGYLYHLLAAGSFTNGSALIALGLDSTLGGAGLLVANKSKSAGIVINQQTTISDATAYGIKITGQTALAPSVRLEQNVDGAADALQIVTFGVPTAAQHGLFISDPAGEAWSTFPLDGRFEGKRNLRIREKDSSTRSAIEVGENTAYAWGATNGYWSQLQKDGLSLYAPNGGGSLYPYKIAAGGSHLKVLTGAAGVFGVVPTNMMIDIQDNKLGFYGLPATVRPSAFTQTYAIASKAVQLITATAVATTAATVGAYGFTQAQADALIASHNALLDDYTKTKNNLNALIDDLQLIGFAQ